MRGRKMIHFSFITGVMFGFELVDDDSSHHLVIDLFIVQILISWEDDVDGYGY